MPRPNPAIVNDPFAWRLALVYAAFFGTTGWHLPFFPVWLSARGLDPAAIGVVLAAFQLARIVATPAGTRLADRHGSLSRRDRRRRRSRRSAPWRCSAATSGFPADPRRRDPAVAGVGAGHAADRRLCAQGPRPARPRLRAGAAVGLGRLHRRERRGRIAVRADRAHEPDLADLRRQLRHRAAAFRLVPLAARRGRRPARRQPATATCASRPSWRSRRPQA